MSDESQRLRVIYFHNGDVEEARALCDPGRNGGKRGITRDARVVIEGEVETCGKVVMLPSVRDADAARIIVTYERAGIPIERLHVPVAPVPDFVISEEASIATPPEQQAPSRPLPPPPRNEELRRMSNKQLRDVAAGRGVSLSSARDRADLIAAIEGVAAQKGAMP